MDKQSDHLGEAQKADANAIPDGWRLLKNTTHDERSWPEDFKHENGNYSNVCCWCLRMFAGHKRRGICKVCAAVEPEGARSNERGSA